MKITKGQHLHVKHTRKGEFGAIALRDFDTETAEFYPLALAKGNFVRGASVAAYWQPGDEIPCRKSHCIITIV